MSVCLLQEVPVELEEMAERYDAFRERMRQEGGGDRRGGRGRFGGRGGRGRRRDEGGILMPSYGIG